MAIARQNNSLKQIYTIFEELADNHEQINDYGKGDIFRINAEMKLKHPTLWVDVQPSTHQKSLIVMNFRVYVMDIVDQSDFAEVDVQSETLFIINDVIQLLKRKYKLIQEQYNIQTTPFEHKFGDRVAGWFANIQVRVPTNYGTCDIPTT